MTQIQISIPETIREVSICISDGYYLLGIVNFVKCKNGIVDCVCFETPYLLEIYTKVCEGKICLGFAFKNPTGELFPAGAKPGHVSRQMV